MALTMGLLLAFESEISPQAHVLKHVALHRWNWVGGISIRPWIEKAGHEEQTEEYIIQALLYVVPDFCLWLCGGRPPYVLNFNGLKLSGNPLFLSYVVNSWGFLSQPSEKSLKQFQARLLSVLAGETRTCVLRVTRKETRIILKTNLTPKCGRGDPNKTKEPQERKGS